MLMADNPARPEVLSPKSLQEQANTYFAMFESFKEWLFNDPLHAISINYSVISDCFILDLQKAGHIVVNKVISQATILFSINHWFDYDFNLRYKKHIILEHRLFNV
jgi:hypothetical protein